MTETETDIMYNHSISELEEIFRIDLIQHPHFTDQESEGQTESFGQMT